jgi:hypothetical protein
MSDFSAGPGWWQASDGRWYPPPTGPTPSDVADAIDPGRTGFNLGLVSFIVGVVSLVCCLFGFVPGIAAIVIGFKARSDVAKGQGTPTSAGFAMAGIILGCLSLVWLPVFIVGLLDDSDDGDLLSEIDPVDEPASTATTRPPGRPVAIDADATIDGETLLLEGSANLPDGTILVVVVTHEQTSNPAACPSEPLERCTAKTDAEVEDGAFTAEVDIAEWPPGRIDVRVALELEEGRNDDQPDRVIERYGENGERLRGDQVIEADGAFIVELVVSIDYPGAPPPEPEAPAAPVVPTTVVAPQPPPAEPPVVAPPAAPSGCHPSYSGCVPVGVSDVDCAGGSGNGPAYVDGPITVVGPDVYDLDRDGDGMACES